MVKNYKPDSPGANRRSKSVTLTEIKNALKGWINEKTTRTQVRKQYQQAGLLGKK